jgi:hypothetical protein
MKTRIRAIVAAVIATLVLGNAVAQTKRRAITVQEGRQLVYRSLRVEGFIHQRLSVSYYKVPDFPAFQFFDVQYGTNPYGSSTVGAYAVEETTGEVWDGIRCGHYTSPVLRKMQQQLRRRIGLTDEDRRRIQKPGPNCADNEDIKEGLEPMIHAWQ